MGFLTKVILTFACHFWVRVKYLIKENVYVMLGLLPSFALMLQGCLCQQFLSLHS